MSELAPPIVDVAELPDGGRLLFGEWPGGGTPLVAIHGLTNQHRNLAGVAAALAGERRVVAPDLRGRGGSSAAPDPSTIDGHARDVLALMDAVGVPRAILAGHSMGAYVAVALAGRAPERVAGAVLIDGGVMLAADVEAIVASVRPLLGRLTTSYPSPEAYVAEWEGRGIFDGHWGPVVRANLGYDLGRRRDGYVPKADPRAALDDLRDIAATGHRDRLAALACPVLAITAEGGMAPGGPPVIGEAELAVLRAEVADLEVVGVPGTGHHTVTISDRGAAACAAAIRPFAARLGD